MCTKGAYALKVRLQVRDAARYPPRDLPALLARALPLEGPAASLQIPVVNYPLQVCANAGA